MDFSTLNPQQKSAVTAPARHLLVVAGAGTGKTQTLVSRLLYIIESGAAPSAVCALTFTNKAAREMAARARVFLRTRGVSPGSAPFIGTFHSLGASILRREARRAERGNNFVIFDDHDSFQLLKKILKAQGGGSGGVKPAALAQKVSDIKNGTLELEVLGASSRPDDVLVARLFEAYEEELKKNNAFDFDDLIVKVVALWARHPDIRDAYRRRFRHVLIDEYQDINRAQYELVRQLVGKTGRLTAVGDDQQTIYSWRGSNFEFFLNFENEWPETRTAILDQNYRSSGHIISASSALIANNRRQKQKTLWTENPAGEAVRVVETAGEDEEAEYLAEEIENSKRKNPNRTIGVLYRTNAQSRALEYSLAARTIPYRIWGGLKFYERREIRDLVAAMRFAFNPKDSTAAERLEKMLTKRRFRQLADQILEGGRARPADFINHFLAISSYAEYGEANLTNWEERRENIAELLRFAERFSEIAPFLEELTLLQATDTAAKEGRAMISSEPENVLEEPVWLMTIHMAKGLEFDAVFLAGCCEEYLPHPYSVGSEAELEEERRLMYVAMTRARRHLTITFFGVPSRFLFELPGEHVKFESAGGGSVSLPNEEESYITLD